MKPELMREDRSGRIYIVTAKRKDGTPKTRHDVTDEFKRIEAARKEDLEEMRNYRWRFQ